MTAIILYTAIYGGYDNPKPVPSRVDVECILFTDSFNTANEATRLGWNAMIVKMDPTWSPMLQHKWWKMHPSAAAPDSNITLWLDGSMDIIVDDYVGKCVRALGDDDFTTVLHPARNCIYDEAYFSAQLARYDAEGLHKQVDYYRSIGQPSHDGLYATGANVRRINAATRELGKHWWWENLNRTHQDQVSLPVILRRRGSLPARARGRCCGSVR